MLTKSVRTLMLFMEEESYLSRFERVRGYQYNLTELIYTVSVGCLEMPFRELKAFVGTNRSNVLGPVACLPFKEEHHNLLEWKEKKNVWSAACKFACKVGGQGEEGIVKGRERKTETVEPVCFHAHSSGLCSELLHMHSACGVIDLTVGPGYLAEACIAAKVPFVGLVQTITHETIIRRYLFKRTWDLMQNSHSLHYEPDLHMMMDKTVMEKRGAPQEDDGGGAPASGGSAAGQAGVAPAKPPKKRGAPSKSEPNPKKPKSEKSEKSAKNAAKAAKVLDAINQLKLDTGKKDKDDAKEEPSDSVTDPDDDDVD